MNNTPIASISLSPDGRYVFSSPRAHLDWGPIDSDLGSFNRQAAAQYEYYKGPSVLSPDGQYIAAAGSGDGIQIRNAETGEITAELADYRPVVARVFAGQQIARVHRLQF